MASLSRPGPPGKGKAIDIALHPSSDNDALSSIPDDLPDHFELLYGTTVGSVHSEHTESPPTLPVLQPQRHDDDQSDDVTDLDAEETERKHGDDDHDEHEDKDEDDGDNQEDEDEWEEEADSDCERQLEWERSPQYNVDHSGYELPDDILKETMARWTQLSKSRSRRVIRDANLCPYNISTFLEAWCTPAGDKQQYKGAKTERVRELIMALRRNPVLVEELAGEGFELVRVRGKDPLITIRREMRKLKRTPAFRRLNPDEHQPNNPQTVSEAFNSTWLDNIVKGAWNNMTTTAPFLTRFLSQLLQNQEKSVKNIRKKIFFDQSKKTEIFMLESILMRGFARNQSMFLCELLGVYMRANGTPRRVVDSMSNLGVSASYSNINRLLSKQEVRGRAVLKLASRDPKMCIGWDNYNFLTKAQDIADGNENEMVNLTVGVIFSCPDLNGRLSQRHLNLQHPFTLKMVYENVLPRRPSIDNASVWLVKHSMARLLKLETIPTLPVVRRSTFRTTPFLQLGAIWANEGTIEGTYEVHDKIFNDILELPEKVFMDDVILCFGDQMTTSLNWNVKQSQQEASEVYEKKQFMLPLCGWFHCEMAIQEVIVRNHFDTGKHVVRKSLAVLQNDVEFLEASKHVSKKKVKYHHFMTFLTIAYSARILALVLYQLELENKIQGNDWHVDNIIRIVKEEEEVGRLDGLLAGIHHRVFSYEGWTGKYEKEDGTIYKVEDIDTEFRSQCRLLQSIEILLLLHESVRHGDWGTLRDLIPQLVLFFFGGGALKYGPEMMRLVWLLHSNVITDEHFREAIIQSSLVRCTTTGSMFKAIDLLIEHLNKFYALDIKNNKNSTHNIKSTFSTLANSSAFFNSVRKSVELNLGKRASGRHKRGDPTTNIVMYAIKLCKDGIGRYRPGPGYFDAPDIFARGQEVLLEKLPKFNDTVVQASDGADQQFLPGFEEFNDKDDGVIDYDDAGNILLADDDADDFFDQALVDDEDN